MKKKFFIVSATLSLCVFTACGNSSAGTNNQVSSNSGSTSSAVADVGKTSGTESKEPVVSQIENKEAKETIENSSTLMGASVGDIIKFGAYEQDNDSSNGKEEIEWVVLAKEEDKALVISKYALDTQPYNTTKIDVTWETCSLRKWLNTTFISNAFNSDEKEKIQTTNVTADENPTSYRTPAGNDTTDKVFLLSIPEADEYFSSNEARKCAPTEYAKAQGVNASSYYSVDGKATCWWWLRSPGDRSGSAAGVLRDGAVDYVGYAVYNDYFVVRPTMWINLGSEVNEDEEVIENSDALKDISVGDIVKFGAYEQDNNSSNGKEEIEWVVLAKDGNKALVISKYALDCQLYNTTYTDVTWETCSLREWLNGEFISNAFSSDEQKKIQTTTVTADNNPEYDTPPGNNTTDKVFLLSIQEANKYFSSDNARMCAPTEYAKAQGVYANDRYSVSGKATCWWWLRSPGGDSDGAAGVGIVGAVIYGGDLVNYDISGVRPALWIDIGS